MTYFNEEMSGKLILKTLGERLQKYRLNRNLSQVRLAKEAGVSARTIIRLEEGQSVQSINLIHVLRILGLIKNLENLVPESTISPIQLARREGKARKHAYKAKTKETSQKEWSWDDNQ